MPVYAYDILDAYSIRMSGSEGVDVVEQLPNSETSVAAPEAAAADDPGRRERDRPTPTARAKVWWRRPWIVPLMLSSAIFIGIFAPPYFMSDYQRAPIEFRPG